MDARESLDHKAYTNYAFIGSESQSIHELCFHWLNEHGGAVLGVKEAGQSSKDARDASMRTPGVSRLYSMGGYIISLGKQQVKALNFGTF